MTKKQLADRIIEKMNDIKQTQKLSSETLRVLDYLHEYILKSVL